MKRTIVGLRKKNGKYKIPTFAECVVDYFGKDLNSVTVKFSIENGTIVLDENEDGYELTHSPECPIKLLSNSNKSVDFSDVEGKDGNIGVAASVVIESSDSQVLLTKRSGQLRSSPNTWVLPGGHIDYGESVFEAGAREVKEETGLHINHEKLSVLGLWENVYPLLLGIGAPKTHAIVFYLYTQINESSEQLEKKLIPNSEEVDSYCWMSSTTLHKLINAKLNINPGKQLKLENGVLVEKSLDYTKMFNNWLWTQPKPYTGVNYALRKWLEQVTIDNMPSKI